MKKVFGIFDYWLRSEQGKLKRSLLVLLLLVSFWLIPHQQKIWGQQEETFIVKKVDLSQYGTVASIDRNPESKQLAIGFNNCNLIVFDDKLNQKDKLFFKNCKRFFRARYGKSEEKTFLVSSIYTGSTVLSNSGENFDIPLHKAAVTDSLIIQDYLLSSSDDGTVQISRLLNLSPPQVNTLKLYESIGVARNLAFLRTPTPETGKVAVSYDTGEISIFNIDRNTARNPVQPTTFRNINSRINTFKFTADGSKLLIGYFTGELVELDLTTGANKILLKVDSWLNTLDINAQNLVAIGDDSGFVKVISLGTGKIVEEHQISSTGINALIFMDDQTIIAADAAGMVYQGRLIGAAN